MTDVRQNLTASASVVLDGAGAGTVALGPTNPPYWRVLGVIVQTDRPGEAPVPRVQVFLDRADPSQAQGLTYDGSFSQGATDMQMTRGSELIAVWSGGQSGDRATLTITGEKW